MKKIISFILIVSLIFIPIVANAREYPEMQVKVDAKACVLMEETTGKVLMAANADEKLYPASITKIMTLILVNEAIDSGKFALTDVVTVSENASKKGGSQIWLKENEQMSVDDLLKATSVASANDACTALAELVAGSESSFVTMMNDKAKALGMKNTNFENCTGLDDDTTNHFSTAFDIAIMTRELLKHERVKNYSTIWTDSLRGGETQLVNTNKLIKSYNGITGLKTGTTSKAGCCVSATAQRDGLNLIAVVLGSLNSKERFNAAKQILDWGFANYSCVKLEVDKSLVTNINVINGVNEVITPIIEDGKTIIVPKGKEKQISQSAEIPIDVQAPIEEGQTLGKVVFTLDGNTVGECKLYNDKEIRELTVFERLKKQLMTLV